MSFQKIQQAVELIKSGFTNRVDLENVTIYKCGTVIRIDIKGEL